MKKAVVIFTLLCLLTVSASAAYIPEDVITENRDGRQLIIKTFQLGPTDDPTALVEEPFELEGYRYEHLETVKEEQPFKDTQQHAETVTVDTDSNSLEKILAQLAPTMEYSKDGYSGILTLDHTTIQTEAAGYTTQYYTITDTKQFTGLDRNDPSYRNDLGRQPFFQFIRCLHAHRPGGDSLLFSDVLSSHQKGLFLVFRLQVHP